MAFRVTGGIRQSNIKKHQRSFERYCFDLIKYSSRSRDVIHLRGSWEVDPIADSRYNDELNDDLYLILFLISLWS